MTKVLIADDHAIVRHGLKQILEQTEDIEVSGEAEDGAQAINMVRAGMYDVVVLDASMPVKAGLEALAQLKREFPKLPILVLSMYPEKDLGVRAIREGAAGYLSKQSAPAQLVAAIRQVAAGRRYISPALAEMLAQAVGGDDSQAGHASLSTREFQTLCLIASGKTLSGIAAELNISVKTVSVYRARVLEKLHLKNNAELTHYAIRHGLIESL